MIYKYGLTSFLKSDSAPGILLLLSSVFALFISNTPIDAWYEELLDAPISIGVGGFNLAKPALLWVNDGLMAIFFLFVALELKREALIGNISSIKKILLPGVAAIGGVIFPAIIFYLLNRGTEIGVRGWAIPTATDIVFALGLLILFVKNAPSGLRALIISIAIFDDLVAILIIALFYSDDISSIYLLFALGSTILLFIFNFFKIRFISVYILVGLILWFFILKSGVHATLSGVIIGLSIPLYNEKDRENCPLHSLEKNLKPWVNFLILPLFAFFNVGISLSELKGVSVYDPVPVGIILGLFFGKQLGIFSFSFISVKLGIASLPRLVTWKHMYGLAIFCGIGFTMSLFVSSLAYGDLLPNYWVSSKLGILLGSLISTVAGYIYFRLMIKSEISQ